MPFTSANSRVGAGGTAIPAPKEIYSKLTPNRPGIRASTNWCYQVKPDTQTSSSGIKASDVVAMTHIMPR